MEHIYPATGQNIPREEREARLKQKAKVFWLTGLSGSGKTTLACNVERNLFERGYVTRLLDGDNVRSGINKNLGFSLEARMENIRRIAEISKLFLNTGIITICAFVSPTEKIRNIAREIIGENDFYEIFVNTPIEVCEKRDVKGLYAKARAGIIKNFTGISAPFESPRNPDLVIDTAQNSLEGNISTLLSHILPEIKVK